MSIALHAFHRAAEIVQNNHEIADGDIVLLPDPGPSQGLLAIKAGFEGDVRIRKLTRVLDEVLDSRTVEEDRLVLTQPYYADSVAAALALVNQSNDTIIPYYNPRFRLLDHYIPGRTRERRFYRHSVLVRTLVPGSKQPLEVIQVWYGGPDEEEVAPGNFVGLVFSSLPGEQEQQTWSPTHGSGLHSGMSLGRFPDSHQAGYELIRFDLAATATQPEVADPASVEDTDASVFISYDPMLED